MSQNTHSMTRLSDASSLRDSQAAWMTDSQKGALDQQEPQRPSPPTTTSAAGPAQASASATKTEGRPAEVKQHDYALAHSLPDQSFLPTAVVQAASHQHQQQDQSKDGQDDNVTFTELQHMPQSTAPAAQQQQQQNKEDMPVSMDISSRESQQDELQEEQDSNDQAPVASGQTGPTDESGSRSMELTDVRTGNMRHPLQQQILSPPEQRLHSEHHHSSPADHSQSQSQSQSRSGEDYSQSQSDQTQLCETPELPPMVESTRDNRPQFGPSYRSSNSESRGLGPSLLNRDTDPASRERSVSDMSTAALLGDMSEADTQNVALQAARSTRGHHLSSASSNGEVDQPSSPASNSAAFLPPSSSARHEAARAKDGQQSHESSQDVPLVKAAAQNASVAQDQKEAHPENTQPETTVIPDSDPGLPHLQDRNQLASSQEAKQDHHDAADHSFETSTPRTGAAPQPAFHLSPPSLAARSGAETSPLTSQNGTSSGETSHEDKTVQGTAPDASEKQAAGLPAPSSSKHTLDKPPKWTVVKNKARRGSSAKGKRPAHHTDSDEDEVMPVSKRARSARPDTSSVGPQPSKSASKSWHAPAKAGARFSGKSKSPVVEIPDKGKARDMVIDHDHATSNPEESDADTSAEPTQPDSQTERQQCGQLLHPALPELPLHRVFAYSPAARCYFPAEIVSLAKDRAQCRFDDGEEIWPIFKDLRLCQLKEGDAMMYAGVDDSQGTAVRPPVYKVYRLEWADRSGRVVPAGTELGPSMIVAARSNDDPLIKSRFQVRAIKIPAGTKRDSVLQDRKLPPATLSALRGKAVAADPEGVVFGARSNAVHGSPSVDRRSTSVPWPAGSPDVKPKLPGRRNPRASPSSDLFHNMGFFLTGFVKDEQKGPPPADPAEARKRLTESSIRAMIQDNGGAVLEEISSIVDINVTKEGKPSLRFSSAGQQFGHVSLIANTPSRKSVKYLLSLALGLPCLSTVWLEQSVANDTVQPVSQAFIGSGLSHTYGTYVLGRQAKLVNESDFSVTAVAQRQHLFQVFAGKRFLHVVASSTPAAAIEAAQGLLAALGATTILRAKDKDRQLADKMEAVDLVLVEERAKSLPLDDVTPRVDMKWVKECLISGQVLKPSMYKWD